MAVILAHVSEVFVETCTSPFGHTLVVTCPRGLCGLLFPTPDTAQETLLKEYWPKATRTQCNPFPLSIETLFSDTPPEIPLVLHGTPFQQSVWQALQTIPCGKTTTYSEVATHIGKPKAVRAVAGAIGANPISWLIPCHRVRRKDGTPGGYRWGLEIKQQMLAYEQDSSGR